MRGYGEALIVGLSVGVLYGLLKFRSPAPPMIALIGLLGMLVGEQIVTLVRERLAPPPAAGAESHAPPVDPS